MMNKFALPAILVAAVMVAGLFAFAPVEQASTVHSTIGLNNIILEDSVVLPLSGTSMLQTFECGTSGGLITAFWQVDEGTGGDESNFWVQQISVSSDNFADKVTDPSGHPEITSNNNKPAFRNQFDRMDDSVSDTGLPCPPNGSVVFEYFTGNGDNDVTVHSFFAFQGSLDASVSNAPA